MLTRREFLKNACVFAGACAVPWLTSSSEADNRKKPNIIFFFIDDMGWQDTSEPFYEQVTELNKRYHTPHMERLVLVTGQ